LISFFAFHLPSQLIIKESCLWFALASIFNHFNIQSALVWEEIRHMGKSLLYFYALSVVIIYPNVKNMIFFIIIGFFMFCVSIFVDRMLRIILRDFMARKTLIIGTGYDAYRIGKIAIHNRFAITDVIGYVKTEDGYVDENFFKDNKNSFNLYEYHEIDGLLEKDIDQIIIAIPRSSQALIDELSKKIFGKAKHIKIVPNLDFDITFLSRITDFDGVLLISTSRGEIGLLERIIKRAIDIFASLIGVILLIPLTICVYIMNKYYGDTGSIFFKQKRIGLNGKPIYIYKYRSMIDGAEEKLEELIKQDDKIRKEYSINKKLVNDPRITKTGYFLRRTSLDEFPQFINILKGEMSLVGPRPYLYREKEDMDVYYNSIIACKPGLTGMWQANGRSNVNFTNRCKLDDFYYKNWTLSLDIIIIYKTIKSIFYGEGAL
jgi:undecaprenyl-phosphate galactose phosphotransferase